MGRSRGRDATGGCPEHDRRGLKGIGADEPSSDSATGSWAEENDLKTPTRLEDLEALVDHDTRDPESPLRWTCKSVRRLAAGAASAGSRGSRTLVATCSMRRVTVCKPTQTTEGDSHPDRDARSATQQPSDQRRWPNSSR